MGVSELTTPSLVVGVSLVIGVSLLSVGSFVVKVSLEGASSVDVPEEIAIV